jgi:alpha-ketoglutarate-dependent taurine dioxygenase
MSDVSLKELSPAVGVEVRGVDLSKPVDEAVAQRLREAFRDRLLVLFRGQQLSEEDHVRAVSIFGPPLDEFDDGAASSLVSNNDRGAYIGTLFNDQELIYHSDLTNTDCPPWGLSLYGMDVGADAAGTKYFNAQYAYDHLPRDLRDRLDQLTVVDAYEDEAYGVEQDPSQKTKLFTGHQTTHPAVIEHPRNGRRQIYCSEMWSHRFLGLDRAEAKALRAELFGHLYSSPNMYLHKWATGDLIIWDNIGLQHGRDPIAPRAMRRLRRVPTGVNQPSQAAAMQLAIQRIRESDAASN